VQKADRAFAGGSERLVDPNAELRSCGATNAEISLKARQTGGGPGRAFRRGREGESWLHSATAGVPVPHGPGEGGTSCAAGCTAGATAAPLREGSRFFSRGPGS